MTINTRSYKIALQLKHYTEAGLKYIYEGIKLSLQKKILKEFAELLKQ